MKLSNIPDGTRIDDIGKPKLTPDKLLNALFWIYDGFDRALMGHFFVFETAADILQNKDLEGDGVHVGVRKLEWTAGAKPIFDAFVGEPINKSERLCEYDYNGVPVYVHIFDSNDPCIREPAKIMYRNEFVNLPNSYPRFIELFGNVWK